MIDVPIKRLREAADLPLPRYATPGAAGLDLLAAVNIVVPGHGTAAVSTGVAMAIPEGFEGQIRGRSGLARLGITAFPGTIDPDYTGPITVLILNNNKVDYEIMRGERIAQIVFAPCERGKLVEVDELVPTERGAGGFGSTGR